MRVRAQVSIAALVLAAAAVGLALTWPTARAPAPPNPPIVVAEPGERVHLAAIGDYGDASPSEASVAELVHGWRPDLVITMGDNNYPSGSAETIDTNIGQFYADFIAPYRGVYGEGADKNRFFPSLGNHDWGTAHAAPYLEYFDLPGNERYYDLVWGPVHLFALDSDTDEPDGTGDDSVQAQWLRSALAASSAPWKVVYFHHAPYSSGEHGGSERMRWPFGAWGADLVLSGHDHHYERLQRDGVVYLVCGLSGSPRHYEIRDIDPASEVRVTDVWGAIDIEATPTTLRGRFVDDTGRVHDTFELTR